MFVINSQDAGAISPTAEGRAYNVMFHLPQAMIPVFKGASMAVEGIRLNWDVLEASGENEAGSPLDLLFAAVSAVDDPAEVFPFASFDFTGESEDAQLFTSRDAAPFINPPESFRRTTRGLWINGIDPEEAERGSIDGEYMAPTIFGYWGLETDVPVVGGTLYRLSWTVETDGVETAERKSEVPTFRLRVNDSTLQSSAYTNIDSRDNFSDVPMDGEPVTYTTYYQAPAELDGENWIFSFDYIYADQSDDDPTIALILKDLTVEELVTVAVE